MYICCTAQQLYWLLVLLCQRIGCIDPALRLLAILGQSVGLVEYSVNGVAHTLELPFYA
jgi:hypothetical protein